MVHPHCTVKVWVCEWVCSCLQTSRLLSWHCMAVCEMCGGRQADSGMMPGRELWDLCVGLHRLSVSRRCFAPLQGEECLLVCLHVCGHPRLTAHLKFKTACNTVCRVGRGGAGQQLACIWSLAAPQMANSWTVYGTWMNLGRSLEEPVCSPIQQALSSHGPPQGPGVLFFCACFGHHHRHSHGEELN